MLQRASRPSITPSDAPRPGSAACRAWRRRAATLLAALVAPALAGAQPLPAPQGSPALGPPPHVAVARMPVPAGRVIVEDRTLESTALGRAIPYRVLLPPGYVGSSQRYPVLYLLHGLTGTFSDWERRTRLSEWLEAYRVIVVLPEGQNAWYADAVGKAADRFETYIVDDLVADVEKHYRAIASRHARAIAGLSMGGYGALKFALKRPGMFVVAGSLSGALGQVRATPPPPASAAPTTPTPFQQTLRESLAAAFGPPGSEARAANDLFVIAEKADAGRLPYLYLDCGTEDGLLAVNREFVAMLHARKVAFEYHEVPGAHTWDYWDRQVVEFLRVAARRMPIGGPGPH